jgi:cell division protein FtsA
VRISIFNAFAPLIHLGALQTVADMLDLDLVAIVAEPYAVARCLDDQQVQQAGALFIDVGGGTTDVALVRQGGIEGTRMFALGGRAFTKSLADRLELSFQRAEEIKVAFARGLEVERGDEVAEMVAEDVAVWTAGVELVLEEFARTGMLPGRIYLCGGGARLPQIAAALREADFGRRIPFVRPPHVEAITVSEVAHVVDATGLLHDEQDIPPMALAHQALEMSAEEAPLDAALRRVLRQMKV